MSMSKLDGFLAGPVPEMDLANKSLGAAEARELAAWLSDTPGASDTLKVLDLSANDVLAADEGALEALFEALKACAIERLDISKVGLGPAGLTLFSAGLAPGTPFSAAVNNLRLDGNPITGSKYKYGRKDQEVEEYDCDLAGISALFEAIKMSSISILSLADCDIGVNGISTLAKFTPDSGALNAITISSTGSKYESWKKGSGPRTYSLEGLQGGADPNLDLSSKNLGPADLQIVSAVVTSFRKCSAAALNERL
jgi:hypothetical protein